MVSSTAFFRSPPDLIFEEQRGAVPEAFQVVSFFLGAVARHRKDPNGLPAVRGQISRDCLEADDGHDFNCSMKRRGKDGDAGCERCVAVNYMRAGMRILLRRTAVSRESTGPRC